MLFSQYIRHYNIIITFKFHILSTQPNVLESLLKIGKEIEKPDKIQIYMHTLFRLSV